ncbi:MAG TPA: hypothetical protein VHA07_12030, partial [Devosia sp.]|nr:hypothetical protein [Devosia sp.]
MSSSDGPSEKPPLQPWGRLRWGAGLAIPVLAATLFVSILVLAAVVAIITYRDTLRHTENECQRVVAVAAEHVARIAEETDRSLRVVAQWIERNPDAPLDAPDLVALAEIMTLDPGQTRAIAVIDSTGQAVRLEPGGTARP